MYAILSCVEIVMGTRIPDAIAIFKVNGGILSSTKAIAAGVHPGTLYEMRDAGRIEALSRGIYRLTDMPPMTNPDWVTVATRIPMGVICLISALAYYELTTQIPHKVHLALPRSARYPRLAYPPLRVYHFSKIPYQAGVEEHKIDGVAVRVYSREKTLADCFKYRGKIGMDVVLEAFKTYRGKRPQFQKVLEFARICRVERLMRPYLESIA
jgi:predicted transcriptional regulator of viral defense system